MNKDDKLDFTGERFTPECEREIWYEHYHRYAFTKDLAVNKKVLDIACGEGYGSDILANSASTVIGIDIDENSIGHAKKKYNNKNNLTFIQGSCLDIPLDDHSIDMIVSFETLEHLAEHKQMLAEFDRVLKKDGILIISTPDKKHYSDATGFNNEFHVKELYQHEFKDLLDQNWQHQVWFSQAMSFHSVLEKMDSKSFTYASDILVRHDSKENNSPLFSKNKPMNLPMYYVVLASKNNIENNICDLHLFADDDQSIYGHYNAVIRAHISYKDKYEKLAQRYKKLTSIAVLGKFIQWLSK